MPWLIVLLGYLFGSIPTAYIASRLIKGRDIRQMGDGNVGAQNAFRQFGKQVGILVFLADAGKGALVILIAQATNQPQAVVLLTGAAAVMGHSWPLFLGFRGGRGEATTIGVLFAVITLPVLIMFVIAMLALLRTRNVILASAVGFVPLPLVCWLTGVSATLAAYGVALPCLVGFTHFLKTHRTATRHA